MMNSRETLATEHRSLSYMAADTLGSSGHTIGFRRKGGWFITKTYAFLLLLLVMLLFVVAVLLGRCSVNRFPDSSGTSSAIEEKQTPADDTSFSNKTDPETETSYPFSPDLEYLVEPIHYELYLDLSKNIDNSAGSSYFGNVTITFHVRNPISNITLHAKELNIEVSGIILENHQQKPKSSALTNENIENTLNRTVSINVNNGILNLSFNNSLEENKIYDLRVKFSGILHDLPYGIYRFKHSESSTIKYGIATNMNYPFARTVFPCFENVGQKATFGFHIGRNLTHTETVFNTHRKNNQLINSVSWDHFETTSKLSLDQLAFVISNYQWQTKSTNRIDRLNIWTKIPVEDEISYLLEQSTRSIEFYTEYFQTFLPTRQMDVFLLPTHLIGRQTFENVVMIRESDVSFNDTSIAELRKEKIAKNIAGLFADQWIPHLISLRSEQDLQTRNAILNYIKYECVHQAIEPKWNILEQLQLVMQKLAYELSFYYFVDSGGFDEEETISAIEDFLSDSYQLPLPIKSHPKAINKSKRELGLLIMLKNSFTEPVFKSGLHEFLKIAMEKDTVTVNNLWNSFSKQVNDANYLKRKLVPDNKTVEEIVQPWLTQAGIPLVTVTIDYEKKIAHFTQKPLLVDEETNADHRWFIPISYTTNNERNFTDIVPKLWLENEQNTHIKLDNNLNNQTWILVNLQQSGLYRTQYDNKNWKLLESALNSDVFPPSTASQLLDDVYHLSYANHLPYGFALNLTDSLALQQKNETIIWNTVIYHFENLAPLLVDNSNVYSKFQNYTSSVLNQVYNRLNKTNQTRTHSEIILLAKLHSTLSILNSADRLKESKVLFDKWKSETNPDLNNPIDSNMRYAVICGALRYGNLSDFNFTLERYSKMQFSNPEKLDLLRASLCFNSSSTIHQLMNATVISNYKEVHELHHIRVIWRTARKLPFLKTETLSYVIGNWPKLLSKYSAYPALLSDVIISSMVNVNGNDDLERIETFKVDNDDKLINFFELINQMEKVIQNNIQWMKFNGAEIADWLNSKSSLQKNITVTPPINSTATINVKPKIK